MRPSLFIAIAFSLFTGTLSAQQYHKINGRVTDMENKGIGFASVVISDNATGKLSGTQCDSAGVFCLTAKDGEYTLEVSLLGYMKHSLSLTLTEDMDLGDITLEDDIKLLKEVKVTANRVEYSMTGYEYNIGGIVALKTKDLADILSTAPGVMVTDKITLYGKNVGNIYVDKRRVQLSDYALVDYLNTFKGENIEKIEIVSDPDISERYGGTAIRITTKKQEGGLASFSSRIMAGDGSFVISPNFNINYRKGKFSFYTSGLYMYMTNDDIEEITSEWNAEEKLASENISEKVKIPLSVNGTAGIGYDISKQDFLSFEFSYRGIHREQTRETATENFDSGVMTSSENRSRDYNSSVHRPAFSAMYSHKFADASELTVTGDYVGAYISNKYVDRIYDNTAPYMEESSADNNTSTFVGYARYTKTFSKSHKINAGVQYSYIDNSAVNDTSSFSYTESEFKPFISYNYNGSKFGVAAGLQAFIASIDRSSYADIAPNLSVNYYINRTKGHILRANYSMNVVRPTISTLNPNMVLSDQDVFVRIGNPDLKSYYGNNFGLDLTMFNRYKITTRYRKANDAISSYMYSGEDGTIYQSYTNNATSEEASVAFNTNMFLFRKLVIDLSMNYIYSSNKIGNEKNTYNTLSYSLVSSLSLPKMYSVSIWAIGNTNKVISYNATKREPLYLKLTLSKRIKKWKIDLAVIDILNSNKGRDIKIDMGGYTKAIANKTNSRSYQISVMYNFNWGKPGAIRRVQSNKNEMNNRISEE